MKDYRVEVKIRNANILREMERRGIRTVAELCRNAGVRHTIFGNIINLKKSPVNSKGEWNKHVLKVCEYLFVMPADLFSQEQMQPLKTNKSSVDIGFDDISRMLDDPTQDPILRLERQDIIDVVNAQIEKLTKQEQQVINLKFGLDGAEHTLTEIAELLNLSTARIGMIERSARRKLLHNGDTKYADI